jgi:cyclopropane-fatty-acyl-phospholipid synthase
MICRKLQLSPQDHLLEIGAGWGGFAVHAAHHYGCRVTTTTISKEQHKCATERVRHAGLQDQIEVRLEDYRDLQGQYDKLVSIEMIEAVGERYLPAFFSVCHDRLKPRGTMLLQAITICDQQFDAYRKSVDFIQRHVFPGGFLPSLGALCRAIGHGSDLRIDAVEDMASHYARTLRAWRHRFNANLDSIRELGYPESLLRMWEFYLSYCEAAFLERSTGCAQLLLSKPD